MVSRRTCLLGLAAACAAPSAAGAQAGLRPVARVAGRLDGSTIARFAQLIRQHQGEVVELDVVGTEAEAPGGVFDIGEGEGNRLSIEYRGGGRFVLFAVEGLPRRLPGPRPRYEVKGTYRIVAGQPSRPNAVTYTLSEVQERYLDRGGSPPTLRL